MNKAWIDTTSADLEGRKPMDDELLRRIYAVYQTTGSLHKTADELGFAYAKVRKALITYGAYSTRFSDEVYYLRCKGYTVEEIAKELETTTKRVSAWLPYEKNIYNLPEKTQDAVRSSNYRKRNEQVRTNFVLAKHTSAIDFLMEICVRNVVY